MLAIGTHVRIKDMNVKHIGTIILRSSSGWYTVEYKKPFRNSHYVRREDLIVVSEEEWNLYNNNIISPNFVINNFGSTSKSIEQEIEEYVFDDVGGWHDYLEARGEFLCSLIEEEEEEFKEHNEFWNLTEEDFKRHSDTTYLNAEEHEDLNKMYIELALLTNDEKWFNELTKEEK